MGITRRDFIKVGGLGLLGGMIIPGDIQALAQKTMSADSNQSVTLDETHTEKRPWGFIVDINKCIGCGSCLRACKLENNVPMEPEFNRTWVERYVITEDDEYLVDSPNAGINGFTADYMNAKYQNLDIRKNFFVPKLCNQCDNPPCVQVCPVAATYSTKEGVVLVDRNACIGCRYCIQACPYGARFLDPILKIVDKCTWCYHRINKGLLPACVEVCPVGARIFADFADPDDPGGQLLRDKTIGVLKPSLGVEPKVYYIGLEKGVH